MNKKWVALLAVVFIAFGGTILYYYLKPQTQSQKVNQVTSSISSKSSSSSSSLRDESMSTSNTSTEIIRKIQSPSDVATITDENADKVTTTKGVENQSHYPELTSLLSGDFSPLEGTWKDGRGRTISFDKTKMLSDGASITWVEEKHGILNGYLQLSNGTGASAFYIPAGVDNSVEAEDGRKFIDPSNKNQARLWFGQSANGIENADEYYYHLSTEVQTKSSSEAEEENSAIQSSSVETENKEE